jgi:hypothetical protein
MQMTRGTLARGDNSFSILSVLPVPRNPLSTSPSSTSTSAPVKSPVGSLFRSPKLVAPWALTNRTRRWKVMIWIVLSACLENWEEMDGWGVVRDRAMHRVYKRLSPAYPTIQITYPSKHLSSVRSFGGYLSVRMRHCAAPRRSLNLPEVLLHFGPIHTRRCNSAPELAPACLARRAQHALTLYPTGCCHQTLAYSIQIYRYLTKTIR